MSRLLLAASALLLVQPIQGQQIWDIWQTTWDRANLFSDISPSDPIDFVSPGTPASADIVVDDTSVYQTIAGFGASLTDASAQLLSSLKSTNEGNYNTLLSYLFDTTDGANAAGISYLRVPLGATDFSANDYSFDDNSGDTGFNDFNINAAPSYVFSTIQDIMAVNPILKVHVLPWSAPAWMKSSDSMNGGSLDSQYVSDYANYLLKCLQGFQSQGITPYAISIQNEPENTDSSYPSMTLDAATEAQIGEALRTLMNNNGFGNTLLIGFEHNWSDAGAYPVELMEAAGSSFDGISFHCYEGSVSDMTDFTSQFPDTPVYNTECTGTLGSDWWSDIKWYMDNLFTGAVSYGSASALMWNLALDGNGQPELPGSDSCDSGNPGCRGVVQINSDGSYSLNQEFYSMAQASKGTIPKDAGGPWAQRIGVSVQGDLDWALVVGAYVTKRVSSTDWWRYSLVVLNWDDSSTTTWNPVDVEATIEFQGAQATYTFPVGVTTLWWYAAPS